MMAARQHGSSEDRSCHRTRTSPQRHCSDATFGSRGWSDVLSCTSLHHSDYTNHHHAKTAVARTNTTIEHKQVHGAIGHDVRFEGVRQYNVPHIAPLFRGRNTIIQPNFGEDDPVRTTTYRRTWVCLELGVADKSMPNDELNCGTFRDPVRITRVQCAHGKCEPNSAVIRNNIRGCDLRGADKSSQSRGWCLRQGSKFSTLVHSSSMDHFHFSSGHFHSFPNYFHLWVLNWGGVLEIIWILYHFRPSVHGCDVWHRNQTLQIKVLQVAETS